MPKPPPPTPQPDQNSPGTGSGQPASAGSPIRRGAWSTEEIAERNRRALMPQGPSGREKTKTPPPPPKRRLLPRLFPPSASQPTPGTPTPSAPPAPPAPPREPPQAPRLSSHGTTPRAQRQRYLTHGKTREEEQPLEPPVPLAAFFAFVCGLCTVVLSGPLSPLTISLAVVSASLAGWMIFQAVRYRRLAGLPWAIAGAVISIAFSSIHYSAYLRGRSSLPALYSVANRGTGNSALYRVQEVDRDFKAIDEALKTYYGDLAKLPPSGRGELGANGEVPSSSPAYSVPTFRIHALTFDRFNGLTTPVGYIGRYPVDFFAPAYDATYEYYPTPDERFALLLSPGPDRVYDIDPEQDFVPGDKASGERLLSLRWDPTNGTRSRGDIWYVCAMPQKPVIDPSTGLPVVPPQVPVVPSRVPALGP